MSALFLLFALAAQAVAADSNWTWWVEPCTAETAKSTGCDPDDPELADWALQMWARESSGRLRFTKADSMQNARLRIHWASGALNLYGEARPIMVNGQAGADIYVLPDIRALGDDIAAAGREDRLFRDTVVYLTCVHESGHALGLRHTRKFADIMYTFQLGGDFVEYFERYRRLLRTRQDIPKHSGISEEDRANIRR